jgi:hypothetical protein
MPSLQQFMCFLRENYPSEFYDKRTFSLRYVDEEKDVLTVTTELEWEEMNVVLGKMASRKILVHFHDIKRNEKKDLGMNVVLEMNDVLGKVMENNNIGKNNDIKNGCCPYSKSGTCFGCLYDPPQCTHQEFWKLHYLSLDCLSSVKKNKILFGKECILKMLEMIPNHLMALYNLACAESLLGNVDEGLNNLEKAIELGYCDLNGILKDGDFDNVKHTERFMMILQKLNPNVGLENFDNNSLDDNVQTISREFNVPIHIVKELFIKYDGDVDTVKTMLYN